MAGCLRGVEVTDVLLAAAVVGGFAWVRILLSKALVRGRVFATCALVCSLGTAWIVDRFLVAADMEGIDPVIVINKVDLEPDGVELATECLAPYASENVPMHITSAEKGTGIEGVSGNTGKSSLGRRGMINTWDVSQMKPVRTKRGPVTENPEGRPNTPDSVGPGQYGAQGSG